MNAIGAQRDVSLTTARSPPHTFLLRIQARDECLLEPDTCTFSDDGATATCYAPSMAASGGASSCTAATFVQPCNWRADPTNLGQRRMRQLSATSAC